MKELFTDITLRNGEVKKIKVELEDELKEWLVTQPEAKVVFPEKYFAGV